MRAQNFQNNFSTYTVSGMVPFNSNYTELIFLFDVLEQVIFKFSFNTEEQLKQFINELPITKIKWRITGVTLTMTYGNIRDQSTLFIMLGV